MTIHNRPLLVKRLKFAQLGPAILCGTAFSLAVSQELLGSLWPVESLRARLAFPFLLLAASGLFFLAFDRFLPQRFGQLAGQQRASLVAVGLLTPLVLAIALVRPQEFSEKNLYFLLPVHVLRVQVSGMDNRAEDTLALTGFETQEAGFLSFNELQTAGWERKGDRLILADTRDNFIAWEGKIGKTATLTFQADGPGEISVSWDGQQSEYEAASANGENLRIGKHFSIPWYAGWQALAVTDYLACFSSLLILYTALVSRPGSGAVA